MFRSMKSLSIPHQSDATPDGKYSGNVADSVGNWDLWETDWTIQTWPICHSLEGIYEGWVNQAKLESHCLAFGTYLKGFNALWNQSEWLSISNIIVNK